MHGQYEVRPTVTFPAAWHHRPLTGTKLYCLITEAHVCEQLAQGCYLKVERPGVKPATFGVMSQHPNYYTTRLGFVASSPYSREGGKIAPNFTQKCDCAHIL